MTRFLRDKRSEILVAAQRHGASNLRVFGSHARGTAREDSDVDLLVDFQPETGLLAHAALQADLEQILGRKVDVVTSRALRAELRDVVLGEAQPL